MLTTVTSVVNTMNQNQINALSSAIAQLFAAIIGGVSTTAPVAAVATKKVVPVAAPVAASSGADLLGDDTPAAAPVAAPVIAKKVVAAKAPAAGLIDMTGLTGLAKARAVAHNNRVTAAAGGGAAPVAAPVAAPAAAPAPVAAKKVVAKKAVAAPAAAVIDAAAIKTVGLALLKKDKVGGSAKLQEILAENGAENLTSLAPENYAAVHAALVAAVG